MKNTALTAIALTIGTPILAGSIAIDEYAPQNVEVEIKPDDAMSQRHLAKPSTGEVQIPMPSEDRVTVSPALEVAKSLAMPPKSTAPETSSPTFTSKPPVIIPMVTYTLDGDVLFDLDMSNIKPAALNNIREIAEVMQDRPNTQALIEAHTCNLGDHSHNDRLSQDRGNAIKEELVRLGIARSRIKMRAYGETRPRVSNDTAAGRALNRRAVVTITTQR